MPLNFKSVKPVDDTVSPLFTLGIHALQDELNQLSVGGVWWLNIDDQKDAVSLINQMIISQDPSAKVAIIASSEILRNEIKYYKNTGPETIQLFSMPDSSEKLGELSRDLMCSIKPAHYFFIVLFPENAFNTTAEHAFKSDLQALSVWALSQQCSLLLLNTGKNINKQYSLLLHAHRSISGLARLMSNHCYDVGFWCNQRGVSAGVRLELQYNDKYWSVIYDSHSVSHNYSDENNIISHVAVLEGSPQILNNWQLCENNEQVFESASLATAATVIFYFAQGNQLIKLTHQIHTLRIQRGNALKIIVREKYGQLRAADVQLLLGCGATLVIPQEVSLPRSLNMIKSVQGTHFSHDLSDDLESILRQMQPKEMKGYQSKEIFINTINEFIQNPIIPPDNKGLLVALRPVPGLRPEQIVTVCRIKRMGDIVTLGESSLMLFLAHCHINDMDSVLRRLFPLQLSNIFSHCLVWHTDIQITAQLDRLKSNHPIVWQNESSLMPAIIDGAPSFTDTAHLVETTATHSPTPVTLLDDFQVKKPL